MFSRIIVPTEKIVRWHISFPYWINQLERARSFVIFSNACCPHDLYVVTLSNVAQYVPLKLLVQHSITLNKSMNLLDHNGKVWPLSITHLGDGRTIIRRGWKDFLEYYNLDTQKDEMDLEIIRKRGRDCEDLKVHIIKHVTPRGRGRPRHHKDIKRRGPGRPRKMESSKSKASDKLSL